MFLRLTDNVTVNSSMHVLPFQNVLYFYFVYQGSAAYDWDENVYKREYPFWQCVVQFRCHRLPRSANLVKKMKMVLLLVVLVVFRGVMGLQFQILLTVVVIQIVTSRLSKGSHRKGENDNDQILIRPSCAYLLANPGQYILLANPGQHIYLGGGI